MGKVIAFQGERGANSEDAVVRLFGEVGVLPCPTLERVFQAVEAGEADGGLVPVENSLAGSIHETFDLLLRYPLHVTGEIDLQIEHCLQALPGQSIEDLKVIYSHPQALAQCAAYLSRLDAEKVAVYDTAGSAKMIAEEGRRGAGAIATARAASIYGLEILARGIQDDDQNFTKFFAVSREPAPYRPGGSRTVLVIGTANRPGALYESLGSFARRGINLTKLESRPSRRKPWDYIFYLVVDAHPEEENLKETLEELEGRTHLLRVLGAYPR